MSSRWAVGPCVPDKRHLVRVGSPLSENGTPNYPGPVQTRPMQLSLHHFSTSWWTCHYFTQEWRFAWAEHGREKSDSFNDLQDLTLPQPRLLCFLILTLGNVFSDLWAIPEPCLFFAFPFIISCPYFLGFSLTWKLSSCPEPYSGFTLGFSSSWPWMASNTPLRSWLQMVVQPAELLALIHPMKP